MHWAEFEALAPELAQLGRKRFTQDQVALIGTIRRDGSPRISPVEPDITNGRLYTGMIWHSYKALDLLRDPRCTVHALIHDRMASGGEFKVHGRAVEINDLAERKLYRQTLYERIEWEPEEPHFHLFAIDIFSAASFLTEEETRVLTLWRAGQPIRKYRDYADGRRVEIT